MHVPVVDPYTRHLAEIKTCSDMPMNTSINCNLKLTAGIQGGIQNAVYSQFIVAANTLKLAQRGVGVADVSGLMVGT